MSTKFGRQSGFVGRWPWLAVLLVQLMLLPAACSYRGGIDNPFVRRATWFSYLDGGDIRAACAAGTPDRYRLVYNARYTEQIRSYEITADGAGGAHLVARALGTTNFVNVSLSDILAPWRWRSSERQLSPAELRQFQSRLAASGMFDGAPAGLRLFSGDFYWVGSACHRGVFHFNAWLYPSERFARIQFADFLFYRDATGMRVNQPRPTSAADRLAPRGRQRDQTDTRFWLQVRDDGFGGLLEAF